LQSTAFALQDAIKQLKLCIKCIHTADGC